MLRGVNDYSKCSNEWMSYMPYDTYRFCVFIDWENGMPTSTYWIDDINFDLDDSAISRVLGIYSIIQYYLEATNIDLNYLLPDGKVLRDVVKDIRFGRALCNSQVYTTGFGMNVYNNGVDDYVSGFADGLNTQTTTKLALYSADFQNTGGSFNFDSTDIIKTRLTESAATTTTGTSNIGISFVGGYLTSSIPISVSQLFNITNQSENTIALYNYTNGTSDIYIRDFQNLIQLF